MPVQRIEKFQPLQAGQCWRAIQDFPQHAMFAGEVYLIEKLAFIDDALHTVYVRNHPKRYGHRVKVNGQTVEAETHEFLVNEFTAAFEFEPDAEKIRAAEVGDVQARLQGLQTETAQATPDTILLEGGFSTSNSTPLLGSLSSLANVTEESLALARTTAENEKAKATAIAKFYQSQADKIRNTVAELAPYFSEKAAGALASVSEVTERVTRMLQGIETLDLYLLKGVEIETVATGASAPVDIPLAIYQRKLYMEEEYCVWADVDGNFDYRNAKEFLAALASNDSLQTQIFGATERAIVCMATCRNQKDYGNAWENFHKNQINREVFLLVRDGGNLYRVFSPVASHSSTKMLFPSFDSMGRYFTGIDGSEIKLEDVRYVKARKDHDDVALHFKRFLILLAGLDAQKQLFGQFYEDNRDFISIEFQRRHMWFVTDATGEKMLPAENRPDVMAWIKEKNQFLRSGSRVFGIWRNQISQATAPACVQTDRQGNEYVNYRPDEEQSLQIAFASGHQIFASISVSGNNHKYEHRTFQAKFLLGRTDRTAFLCLDDVTTAELHYYIHNRDARSHHLEYLELFKRALAYLQDEEQRARPTQQRLLAALGEQGLAGEALLTTAIRSWRAIGRGRELVGLTTDEENELLTHAYWLARPAEFWADTLKSEGLLRVAITGNNKIVAYFIPAQTDHRLFTQKQVDSFEVKFNRKGKATLTSRGMRFVFRQTLTETTLLETPACSDWATSVPDPLTSAEKQDLIAHLEAGHRLFNSWEHSGEETAKLSLQLRQLSAKLSKNYVENPAFFIPLAAYCVEGQIRLAGVQKLGAAALCEFTAEANAQSEIRHWFLNRYRQRSNGETKFATAEWGFAVMPYTRLSDFPFNHHTIRSTGDLPAQPVLKEVSWQQWKYQFDEVSWNLWWENAAIKIKGKRGSELAWFAPASLDFDARFGRFPSKGRFEREELTLIEDRSPVSLWSNPQGDLYLSVQIENTTLFRRIQENDATRFAEAPLDVFRSGHGKVHEIEERGEQTITTQGQFDADVDARLCALFATN